MRLKVKKNEEDSYGANTSRAPTQSSRTLKNGLLYPSSASTPDIGGIPPISE
jgi:hypothetical protein